MSHQASKTQPCPWVYEQSYGSIGSSYSRRRSIECRCGDYGVIRTVTDITNPNCGKKFRGCRNYRNSTDKGCGFFKLVEDDNERELKIEKQKRKNMKLKIELTNTRKWLKMSLVFGFVCFGICLVLGTLIMCN